MGELVKYEKTGQVVKIMLANPPVNAVSTKVLTELNKCFDRAEAEEDARVIIFGGSFVNANKITLGNGGNATVQIGNTTTPTAGGTFDVAPGFNLGATGVQNISYLRTANAKVVGPEVNPARALNNLSYDDNDPTHTLTVAGGPLTVNGVLALTNGRVVATAANKITVTNTATGAVTRTARRTGPTIGPLPSGARPQLGREDWPVHEHRRAPAQAI